MYKKFDKTIFKDLREQHNIFVLVGNGFDISVLKKFESGKLPGKTTSYMDFYDYVTYFNLSNEDNIIYKQMKEDKENGKELWSDFELKIEELYRQNIDLKVIEDSIDDFQRLFTRFLNDLVDAKTLLKLNKESMDNNLAIQSLSQFPKDLKNLNNFKFLDKTDHYDLYNFVFANFNYTSLLDNYMFLDKRQFDPHKYIKADRNFDFKFKRNLNYYDDTSYSSYLILNTIHPHGVQDIPRSILFGIDRDIANKGLCDYKRIVKSYWSQYEAKYESYIKEADLFIIYGMSLGKTDAWWMDKIFDEIKNRNVELIIYKYGNENDDEVKEKFISSCVRHSNDNSINQVKENIHVVTFNANDTYFLGFEKK